MSQSRFVLHRLWLTAATVALLLGLGVTGYLLPVYVHDASLRDRIAACLADAKKAELASDKEWAVWKAAWNAECRLTPESTEYRAYGLDAWDDASVSLAGGPQLPEWSFTWKFVLICWVPFLVLVAFRLWVRWLAKSPQSAPDLR